MVEQRFWNLNLTGTPSAVSSTRLGPNGPNDNFVGVATLGAGSASAVVLGARITSESAIFLGSMTPTYTAVTSGHTSRAFTVTSLTSTVVSADGSRSILAASSSPRWTAWRLVRSRRSRFRG